MTETLSEKSQDEMDIGERYYWEKDVKEFIRLLKEESKWVSKNMPCCENGLNWFEFIDKLAGEKLI